MDLWIYGLVICTAILLTTSAHADRPLLPPPISSTELAAYADRLNLSEAQAQAWRRSSLDYQNDYRERRTALLEELAPLHEELGDVPVTLTTGRAADRFFTRHRAATQELAALDQHFLNSIEPLLSDEQRESLPEVVASRRLATLRDSETVQRWFSRYRLIDWRIIVDDLALESDMRERIEPLLRDAERTILRHLEDLHRQTAQMSIEWARQMDRTEHDPDDPEGIPFGVRFEVFVEVAEPARMTWVELLRHQRATTMRMVRSLPAEESWSFFKMVFEQVPRGRIGWHLQRVDQIIERARQSDLSDEVIDQFVSNVRLAAIDFANELITAHDEWRTLHPPPLAARFDMDVVNYNLAEPRERIDATIARLVAVFDDDTAAELQRIWSPRPGEPPPGLAEIVQRHKEERAADLAPDPFLPGPLPRETLRVFADFLDLSPDQRAEIERLHQEYERDFMRIRRNEVDRVLSIFIGFRMSEDREGMMQYSEPEEVEAKHEGRKDARAKIDAIDRDLEQSIASLLTEEQRDSLIILRLARAGQTDARGLHLPRYHAGEYVAHRACLFRVIDDAKIDFESRGIAMKVLAEHAESLLALLRRLYQLEMEVDYRSNRLFSILRLRDEELSGQRNREHEGAIEALRSARLAVVRETRAALDSILEAIPEADAEQVYEEYLQLAHPSAFADEHAQHDRFRAALAPRGVPDLDTARNERLAEQWAEYQWRYRELSRRMAETMAEATHAGLARDDAAKQEVERISRAVEAIRLERQAANDAAKLALREAGIE